MVCQEACLIICLETNKVVTINKQNKHTKEIGENISLILCTKGNSYQGQNNYEIAIFTLAVKLKLHDHEISLSDKWL